MSTALLGTKSLLDQIEKIPERYIPRLPIIEYLEQNRYIPPQVSKEHAGYFSIQKVPHCREILEALDPEHPATHIACMKSVQTGLTTSVAEGAIAYYIYYRLGSVLYLTSSRNVAKIRSHAAVDVMIDNTTGLAELVGPMSNRRSRKTGDTTYYKEFLGGIQLLMSNYGSVGELKSNPFVLIIRDEWAEAPAELKGQGSTAGLIEGRTMAASRFKILSISTPGRAGECQMYRSFLEGDQRKWFVPCPHCGEMQVLELGRKGEKHGLRFKTENQNSAKILLSETVRYVCAFCSRAFLDEQRPLIMPHGEWRPCFDEYKPKNSKHLSYHISGLMSPFLSWQRICEEYMKAGFGEEILAFKNFVINIQGWAWQRIESKANWEKFKERAGDYAFGEVPGAGENGGLILFGGVDVQQDRVELGLFAFGEGMECWLIEYEVFYGTVEELDEGAWRALAEYVYSYEHPILGQISMVGVDCGYNPREPMYRAKDWERKGHVVREFCLHYFDRFFGIKGAGDNVSELIRPMRIPGGTMYQVQVSQIKEYLFSNIKIEHGPKALHYPKYRIVDERQVLNGDFIYQSFCSEDYREIQPGRMGWHKIFNRNELLDLTVYAHFCAFYQNLHRFFANEWQEFRDNLTN